MKQIITKIMSLTVMLLLNISIGWGQSSVGDIAFLALNADGGDDFAFVALVDISAGTSIYFTDNEWTGSAFNDLDEGELTWTNGASTLSAGTVVVFTDPQSSGSVNVGTLSGSDWNIGAYNEWAYALLSAPATSYDPAPTFLAAIANDAGADWLTGTGLTEGTHAIDFNNDHDGFEYTGARTGQSSFSDYLTIINNTSNWQDEASNGELILPISTTAFTTSAGVDNPTSFSASVQSTSQINLSWTDNASSDNVLLAWNSSNTFGTPTDGNTYSASDAISGGGTVLQYSGTDSYSNTGLSSNTAYYYKVWSYDGSNYSSGVTVNATTLKIEPSNHPTSFSASASTLDITVTWTDAVTGSQAPDGYLIIGETDATITNPSDGTAVADDTDATGNAIAINQTHGSGGSYTFSSLTASTTWYFEIFSYTNSGSDIDYKTDGTIQTTNATTGTIPELMISEVADPSDNTNARFVELYNASGSTINFGTTTFYLSKQVNGGTWYNTQLTGSVTAGDIYIVARSSGSFNTAYGFSPDLVSGNISGNGDDGYYIYYDGTSSTGTLTDSYGVIDEDGTGKAWEYEDSHAVRNAGVSAPNTTWTASEWTISSATAAQCGPTDTSLPVELTSFTADNTRAGEITLNWVTESEIENLGFMLERRPVETMHASSNWVEIASYVTDEALRGQGSVTYRTEYSYTDKTVNAGETYDYRLADVSYTGEKVYHALNVLGIEVTELPNEFALLPAYPNPFNPTTTIRYNLTEAGAVTLTVYDVTGREITRLVNTEKPAGTYELTWNADNIPAGVYFCKLVQGSHSSTQKLILLK